jgi:pimeloyl-ACP methyl ester carboxylesterase/predicted glycosyltransferase
VDTLTPARPAEPSRARYPDEEGYTERCGRRLFYEVYGEGGQTLFFLPTWSVVHSRMWKAQLPYFSRHYRVLTFDGLGNGKSDRPKDRRAYDFDEFALDCLAVMDATGTERAVIHSLSRGAQWALELAANHTERVDGAIFTGPFMPVSLAGQLRWRPSLALIGKPFARPLAPLSPFGRWHPGFVKEDYAASAEWWVRKCIPEAHSTRQIESGIEYSLDTDGPTILATLAGRYVADRRSLLEQLRRVRCPVLVVNGTRDNVCKMSDARRIAKETGGRLVEMEGVGHIPMARKPVAYNRTVRRFLDEDVWRSPSRSPNGRPRPGKRALFISSPIGLGHARRDVAIAKELRRLVPGLEIDWLAQNPVTNVLEQEGETIHPASRHLANESGHMESESAEHDLHCFQAFRRMDEILPANYMVFDDVVRDERYDLWIGDEAWELDYFLHEHPHLKQAHYAWLTDFVGFLPMEDGGEHEAFLTADYNAEMVEHIAASPTLRDRALFVGNPDDIVGERLGPELPRIRDWTEANFDFAGYVTGFEPVVDRERLRAELGYGAGERVCLVTVGGSGVGEHLLRKVIASHRLARELVPELRMIVVAGPRIDPDSLSDEDGLEVRAYVHDLYKHLAACDIAVVQGGLTTAMELTANRRPFVYFPLKHHFEQNFHVRHRLERYGAGRRMDFDESSPGAIATAIAEGVGREVDYLPVETDGARRAAERLAELLP